MYVAFDEWTGCRVVPSLGTNAGAPLLAFQDWRRFKEAFAPELIKRAAEETSTALGRPVRSCSDPFGGSGTTALACQFLGIDPTTIEVNPFLADLIECKLATYPPDTLEAAFGQVIANVNDVETCQDPFPGAPSTFVEAEGRDRFLFSASVARRIAAYRAAITSLNDPGLQRFYRVMLGSITVETSNALISGKGRRYRSGWKDRPVHADSVDAAFKSACLRAIYQVRRYGDRPSLRYRLLRGDSRQLTEYIGPHDLSVFSPPYPNSFDYTDVYNIELWTMGYLNDSADNRSLRELTLRSHVQIKRSFETDEPPSLVLGETLSQLELVRSRLWNRSIPNMVSAYFHDMRRVLRALQPNLVRGGRVYLVVGDSCYCGVHVPVAQIISEEAAHIGYEVVGSEPFRSMRASPQQGGRAELLETLLILRRL